MLLRLAAGHLSKADNAVHEVRIDLGWKPLQLKTTVRCAKKLFEALHGISKHSSLKRVEEPACKVSTMVRFVSGQRPIFDIS